MMKLFTRKPDFKVSEKGISSIESVMIDGVRQYLLIQAEDPSKPILLMIHGGPSMPVPGLSNRGKDYAMVTGTKELVKHFTLVFWDQRGTGKSYTKQTPKESMRLKQYISDANSITEYLLKRFNQPKLHLAGHSWGSVIALSLANQHPEKFHSYTAFSQITSWVENDKLCYQWLLKRAKETENQKALKELTEVGEPPYLTGYKQWSLMRKWLLKYNSMFYNAGDKGSTTFAKCTAIMLTSPDYSLMDVYHSLISGFKLAYTDEMIADLNHFNFFRDVPKLDIPITFIHGEKETHVFGELVQKYYEQLEAPQKKLFWSKKSSHAFHVDDAKENEQILINELAKLTN
ncbi:alpha/beta hydrolase [Neobacillus niacini]|uniref:alpha/beta hydrolase n=1 Tax=Neobacillus niacini TaxID=86668 RepID=UPI0021CAEB84|nr:alpha/beta hydrolase [Neobacillus niacini]MCM3766148.1 alpha/beta hydrolase [Neobacillus niacini]